MRLKRYADMKDGPSVPSDEAAAAFHARTKRAPARPANVRRALAQADPRRWERMQRDLAWMELRLGEMGLNPDDARWYL